MKRFFLLLILLPGLINSISFGQTIENLEKIQNELIRNGEIYIRFEVKDLRQIQDFSGIVSIDKIRGNEVFAYSNAEGFKNFLSKKIEYQLLPHPGFNEAPEMKDQIDLSQPQLWNYYPTYSAYESLMAQFQANYPGLCNLDTIATLTSGRKLLVVRISDNVNIEENEPKFLYTSTIHGDETTGYISMLHLIDYLLTNYGTDTRVTNLVNNIEIWICPNANPDGTYHGGNNSVANAIRFNNNNVDLNRNFPDPEDGQHPDGYPWQQETQAFMGFAQENNFCMSANFHGGEEVVNYPWDTWYTLHPDDTWWQFVCHQYADTVHANAPASYLSGFDNGITNGYAWYTITGGRQDYTTYFHHGRECTIEMSYTKNPPASQLLNYWNYNYKSFLNYIGQSLYGIRGIITDSITGLPLKAKVFITGHDADSSHVWTSLPIGNYHRLIAAGNYDITFIASGYMNKTIYGVSVLNNNSSVLNVQLVPLPTMATVSGTITYANIVNSAMTDVTVLLRDGNNNIAGTALTNSSGTYTIANIPPGTYTFDFQTNKPSGGINSSDALEVLKHFVGISSLSGINLLAGNVDNNGIINSIDALLVQKRFVGLLSTFVAGDWAFSRDTIFIPAGTTIHHLRSLCFGDVNASFIPLP
jgi:hypothetical protein